MTTPTSPITPMTPIHHFRNYTHASPTIKNLYRQARIYQTPEFVRSSIQDYQTRSKTTIPIWDAIIRLNDYIDPSDPDIELPNAIHLFQTAEALRADHHPDWLQLTGLIHDLGKIQSIIYDVPHWANVGDTFLVDQSVPDSIVFPEFNILRSHTSNTPSNICNTPPNPSGLMNTLPSWSHDEYLYRVLLDARTTLPPEVLYIIRFHSLYVWHQDGAYRHLMDNRDHQMLPLVRLFNQYDLYTKANAPLDYKEYRQYYQPLIKKYMGESLRF